MFTIDILMAASHLASTVFIVVLVIIHTLVAVVASIIFSTGAGIIINVARPVIVAGIAYA